MQGLWNLISNGRPNTWNKAYNHIEQAFREMRAEWLHKGCSKAPGTRAQKFKSAVRRKRKRKAPVAGKGPFTRAACLFGEILRLSRIIKIRFWVVCQWIVV